MTRRVNLHRWDDLPLEKITEMVARKVVVSAHFRLPQAYFKKGAAVPVHAHARDVMVYVLQGALSITIEHEDITVREGEVLVVAAGSRHQAESLDDTFVMTFGALE